VRSLARENPRSTAFIERERQRARGGRVAWSWVPDAQIAEPLKQAVLVAEDIDFFSHRGFALAEIRNAVHQALEDGEPPRGASTLTQQLAKNLWLSPSRSPVRKIKEAILTWQLERHLGKRRILELYLNVVEFGPGVFGAEAAARRYFSKPASELTRHEAAQLAAGLPRPRSWNPESTSPAYRRRVGRVERAMARTAWLLRQLD
jgi:monofunctional biosynthetic peptidoglycan transglycosylase